MIDSQITILRTIHEHSLLWHGLKPHPGPLLRKEREVCYWLRWLVFKDDNMTPTKNLSPLLAKERVRVRF
jgi:hypothetical protein